jgi:hypothetical protein
VKQAVDVWTAAAETSVGTIFRRVNRLGRLWGDGLTPKAIWHIVKDAPTALASRILENANESMRIRNTLIVAHQG